jgi:hypothetical protein
VSDTLNSIINGEDDTPVVDPSTLPAAGRTRQAVAAGGNSISLAVGDSFEAIYTGSKLVTTGIKPSNLYSFTLIAPAALTVVTKDKDTKVKTEERKTLDVGTAISCFMGGNGDWAMKSVPVGLDIEVIREADGILPASHKFAGKPVATYLINV